MKMHVLLFTYQTSSMKHHLTETREHNFEIHNIVLILTKYLFSVFPLTLNMALSNASDINCI